MTNDIFWSEIGLGFGEPGGTLQIGVPRSPKIRPTVYFDSNQVFCFYIELSFSHLKTAKFSGYIIHVLFFEYVAQAKLFD